MESNGNETNSTIETFNHVKEHRKESQTHPNVIECDKKLSNMYKCKNCDFETNLKVSLKLHHFDLNHKKELKNQIQFINVMRRCVFCDFQTYSALLLLKHHLKCDKRENALGDETSDDTTWLECGQCPFKTKYDDDLSKHIKNMHSTNFTLYQCEDCPFNTKYEHHLLEHKRIKHTDVESIKLFKCEKCSYETQVEIYFLNHMNTHNKDSSKIILWHQCDKCKFKTKWRKLLEEHIAALHTDPKNRMWYNCNKCEYKTQREDHLELHNMRDLHQPKVREIVRKNEDIVNFLLESSGVCNLSDDDLYFLKQLDRPTPSLNNLLNIHANAPNRRFCTSWYQKCKWLTGSEVRNKLYCWTCLLFNAPSSKSPWHTTGIDNMKTLYRSIDRHSFSKEHLYSAVKYKLLGGNNILNSNDSAHRDSVIRHNEKVKENRDFLRRLIDMTIYSTTEELTFGCHNEKDDSQNQGNFKELAELLSIYDSKFEEFLKSSSVFGGMSKTIQNDLIDSINHVVLESIESEISNSVCFSWEIDETTDVSSQSQLSVVFRFTHEGDIVERFLGFFDVSAGRTADDLFNFLSQQFEKFNLKDKLIGQTYDGASVISGDLIELQSRIKTIAPQALLTHCHAHRLNLILQDSVSSIQECKFFFATLSGISAFFSKSAKRTNVLDNVYKQRVPRTDNVQTSWDFKSRVVKTVLTYRKELLETFEKITRSSDFAYDSTSIRESVVYIDFLNDFDNLFLLNVFSTIFQQTDVISSLIQSQADIKNIRFQVENVLGKIRSFRKDDLKFRYIYESTINVSGVLPKRKSNLPDNDITSHHRRLYYEVLDSIIVQIQDRFVDFDKLQISELLNCNKFAAFEKNFPMDLLNLLLKNYPKLFNREKLEVELKMLYSETTILGESAQLKDMLKLISVNSLQDDLPELFKLLSLILSLPSTNASVGGNSSALKHIKNYAGNARISNFSLIAIERELVKSYRKSPNFFDRVIDHFAQSKDRGIELIYKKL